MEVPRSLQWALSCHRLPPASSPYLTVFAPTFDIHTSHLAMNAYRLDPSPFVAFHPLGAHYGHSPSHPHTYPSEHLPHAQPSVEHIARMMQPPSLSEESIHSGHDGDFHQFHLKCSTMQLHHGGLIHCGGAPSPLHSLPFPRDPGPHSMPPMPTTTYQLSSMCLLPRQTTTTPTVKTAVKRPYHELTTSSSASKRRKRTINKGAGIMTHDDNLLLELRVQQKLPWKVVAQHFGELNRGQFKVPTLQMRYTRLKKRFPEKVTEKIQEVGAGVGNRGHEPPPTIFFFPCLHFLPRYNT